MKRPRQLIEHKERQREITHNPFYHTAAWRKNRKCYLAANPLCVRCKAKGRVEAATDVHHKIPLSIDDDYRNRFAWSGLEGLCHSCHSQETMTAMRRDNRL